MTKLVKTGSISFALALLALILLFLVLWPRFEVAANHNLSALGIVQKWQAGPRHLYQVTCEQGEQKIASPKSDPMLHSVANDQQALVQAARKALFAGDCRNALTYWTLVLKNDPQDESAATMQYLSSGLDRAFFPAGSTPAEMSGFLYGLGLQADQGLDQNKAHYWFAHSFELQPSRWAADRLLAFPQEPHEQAFIWRSLADTLPEEDPNYWWALGQYSELEQDWDRALRAYAEGALIAAKPYDFLIRQGKLLKQEAAWDKAVTVYQQAGEQRPHELTPYLELGHIYREQGDGEEAKAWYAKAHDKYPDNFSPNFYLGLAHFQLEEDTQARQYFQRAAELRPAHAASTYYLAQTLERSGESQKALEYLEKAVSLQAEKPWRWLVELGDWRKREGDVAGALAAYQEALTLQQENPDLLNKIHEMAGEQQ